MKMKEHSDIDCLQTGMKKKWKKFKVKIGGLQMNNIFGNVVKVKFKEMLKIKQCGCDFWSKGLKFNEENQYYICKKCGGSVSIKKLEKHYL